jgi:ABC-type sulfate/molybdate transport systems ATPase subunit
MSEFFHHTVYEVIAFSLYVDESQPKAQECGELPDHSQVTTLGTQWHLGRMRLPIC